MIFRKSNYKDIDKILKIIENAKIEMKKLNLDQWQNGYPNRNVIENDVKNGISYVLEQNQIIGTVALSFEKEKSYSQIEGKWITNGEYAVIHRIAIDTKFQNRGIAVKILEFVEEICLKKRILSLRTDTHEKNEPMKKLLKKAEFNYCGVIYLEDGSEMREKRLAFEKIIRIPHKFDDFRKKI